MQFLDGLRSLVTGLGVSSKGATVSYADSTMSQAELHAAYHGSYLARRIVDIPAEDAIRKGRAWQAEADQISAIEAVESRLGLWAKLDMAIKSARAYGGSAIYIGTDDADVSEPLDTEAAGVVRYITVLARRELSPGELDRDVTSETYGKPRHYTVTTGLGQQLLIHASRLVVLDGFPRLDPFISMDAGWGEPVLPSVIDAVRSAESGVANMSEMLFEANVDVFGIEGFSNGLARGGQAYEDAMLKRMHLMQQAKSVTRSILRDASETYDRKSISFSGVDAAVSLLLQVVCGASGIPATRLMGMAPSGLSSTGDGDERVYFDRVQLIQQIRITPALYRLDEMIVRTALNDRPKDVFYNWRDLRQMSEAEVADVGEKLARTIESVSRLGAFTQEEIRAAASNAMIENGILPGLEAAMRNTGKGFDLGGDEV